MTLRSRSGCALVILSILACAAAPAWALPADQVVTYSIYNTPGVPGSGTAWTMALMVHAQQQSGDNVGWQVTELRITRISNGHAWVEASPTVSSSDGLWWVAHKNPASPSSDDPWQAPAISTTLTAEGSYSNMEARVEGVDPGSPWQPVIDFIFQLLGANTPEDEGDDESVSVESAEAAPQ